mmetsp:Transcript_14466/g.25187  ORF Transcript_14466/g.25187 Transcript_14466/m.25187 type:complete len:637 (+) Transcript_14466:807-2717(+)
MRAVSSSLPADNKLGDLTARVSLELLGDGREHLGVDTIDVDLLGASEHTSVSTLGVVDDELVEVELEHLLTLSGTREVEGDKLISTIVNSPVKLLRFVGSVDNHEVLALGTGAVKEGVKGVTEVLRDVALSTLAEEGISLIDKYDDAAAGGVSPVKELVHLSGGVAAEGSDITTSEDGVVHTRGLGELLCEEGLTGTRGTVEHGVAVGSTVLLGVAGGQGEVGEALLELGLNDDAVESIATATSKALEGGNRASDGLNRGAAGGLADERGLAHASLHVASENTSGDAGTVDTGGKESKESDSGAELLAVVEESVDTIADNASRLAHRLEHGSAHLTSLHLAALHVEVPVLTLLVGLSGHLGLNASALGLLAELALVLSGLALHALNAKLKLLLALELLLLHLPLGSHLVLVALTAELVSIVGLLLLELVVLLQSGTALLLLHAALLDLEGLLAGAHGLSLSLCLLGTALLLHLSNVHGLSGILEALELTSSLSSTLEGNGVEAAHGASLRLGSLILGVVGEDLASGLIGRLGSDGGGSGSGGVESSLGGVRGLGLLGGGLAEGPHDAGFGDFKFQTKGSKDQGLGGERDSRLLLSIRSGHRRENGSPLVLLVLLALSAASMRRRLRDWDLDLVLVL